MTIRGTYGHVPGTILGQTRASAAHKNQYGRGLPPPLLIMSRQYIKQGRPQGSPLHFLQHRKKFKNRQGGAPLSAGLFNETCRNCKPTPRGRPPKPSSLRRQGSIKVGLLCTIYSSWFPACAGMTIRGTCGHVPGTILGQTRASAAHEIPSGPSTIR